MRVESLLEVTIKKKGDRGGGRRKLREKEKHLSVVCSRFFTISVFFCVLSRCSFFLFSQLIFCAKISINNEMNLSLSNIPRVAAAPTPTARAAAKPLAMKATTAMMQNKIQPPQRRCSNIKSRLAPAVAVSLTPRSSAPRYDMDRKTPWFCTRLKFARTSSVLLVGHRR